MQLKKANEALVTVSTRHQAEIAWWWADGKLHDMDYQIKVNDSIDAKVEELIRKYGISDDTQYRCQWEGKLLVGETREQVVATANELALHLATFNGVTPLWQTEGNNCKRDYQCHKI